MNIPAILRQHNIRLKKSLGQNFLIDPAGLQKVTAAAEISEDDRILEVGAGLGNLTQALAEQAGHVVGVEIDQRLFPLLKDNLAHLDNVTLVKGDILEIDPVELMGAGGYQVVANIPYYITSALIRHLLDRPERPERMVLTVQKEVADRICALPGEMSLLALSVQVYGQARITARIPAGAFYPRPQVDSRVVRIQVYSQALIREPDRQVFFKLAAAGFGQKRKMLRNALARGLGQPKETVEAWLQEAEVASDRRAETLSLEEWKKITAAYLRAAD